MDYPGNCWPTTLQHLLLTAALCDDLRAEHAWQKYCEQTDLQQVDYISSTFFPLIYHRFNKSNSIELQICKSVYRHTWCQNHLQFAKLKNIFTQLQQADISICLLKGSAMIVNYYQDAGLRVMGDVDILVPCNQAKKAFALLTDLGWQTQTKESNLEKLFHRTHAISLTHPDGGKLDLHWAIFVGGTIDQALANYTYRISKTLLPQSNLSVTTLCPEDQLIHTLFHGIQYSPQPLIRWLPDAVFILKKTSAFDWNYFFSQAKQLKIELLVNTAIYYLQHYHFAEIPPDVIRIIEEYLPTRQERKALEFTTQEQQPFCRVFQLIWHWHIRSSASQNRIVLLFTLPRFLKNLWQLKHWHQLLGILCHRLLSHFRANFLTQLRTRKQIEQKLSR